MTPAIPFLRVYLGWDASQLRAWNVAAFSLRQHASLPIDIRRLALPEVQAAGLYTRPTVETGAGYWDQVSQAPMSTGHAIARFLVPHLCRYAGWALFTDGDVLVRADVAALVALADPTYAVQVVQHQHAPSETVKMTGEVQTTYARKNWSSVLLFHCGHPANRALTVDLVNTAPGRDLHRFCWLDDALIGALPARWNVLVGTDTDPDPAIVHFTEGTPDLLGYEDVAFADDWRAAAQACGYRPLRTLRRRPA